jgi:transcriptional regulator with XRE-family HTH domain
MRRMLLGMSQDKLAEAIGVTFQQVQKYEKGANRVGASRLTLISDVLGVPLPTLFDGAATAGQVAPDASPRHLLAKPHSLRLLQAFDKVKDDGTRMALLAMVECLAGTTPKEERSSRKRSG